jgi:glycosyltransferase involved in cell wall biosynthesis
MGCERPIHVINMIAGSVSAEPDGASGLRELREQLGLPTDACLIGTFGFIGPTKRPATILQVLSSFAKDSRIKLVIVGQGQDLTAMIQSFGVRDRVICPGFVSDVDFGKYIRAVDVVLNLRYPSMGETSLTLIQAMYHARPCIVTNDAWFAELPNDCLWKISAGETETEELQEAIDTLSKDSDRRRELGEAARRYTLSQCTPDHVASQYMEVLKDISVSCKTNARAWPDFSTPLVSHGSPVRAVENSSWLGLYFSRRIASALPFPDES